MNIHPYQLSTVIYRFEHKIRRRFLFEFFQVTANRLPSLQSVRQSYYQHPPPSTMSRGRSLTPPSFKQNARLPSMSHLRTSDFYPPYYPPHPAMYNDSTFYRTYGDPYLMQRLPSSHFLPPTSPPHAYRHMYSSVTSHRRNRRSRSRSRRRYEYWTIVRS